METREFKIAIDAPREKVWNILWDDTYYRDWTSVFAEGSHVKTDWKEGSKVLFLDGKNSGMVSLIASKKPNEFMSFKHLGIIEDGVEDMESPKIKGWAGALENYTLQTMDGKTALTVNMEIDKEHMDYFAEIWPKALEKVKELAEKSS